MGFRCIDESPIALLPLVLRRVPTTSDEIISSFRLPSCIISTGVVDGTNVIRTLKAQISCLLRPLLPKVVDISPTDERNKAIDLEIIHLNHLTFSTTLSTSHYHYRRPHAQFIQTSLTVINGGIIESKSPNALNATGLREWTAQRIIVATLKRFIKTLLEEESSRTQAIS